LGKQRILNACVLKLKAVITNSLPYYVIFKERRHHENY
jgi:hypothetical protein